MPFTCSSLLVFLANFFSPSLINKFLYLLVGCVISHKKRKIKKNKFSYKNFEEDQTEADLFGEEEDQTEAKRRQWRTR